MTAPDRLLGIDVGGTNTRVVVFDRRGQQLHVRSSSTPSGPEALVDHLLAEVRHVTDAFGRPCHVGIGVPGRVTPDGTMAMALNVGVDRPVALATQLTARIGVPVTIENDVNAAALGAGRSLGIDGSLAYLSVGTGFAAGLVIGGKIVRGSTGTAGEIGHVPVAGSTVQCVCGQLGCIEAIASGGALTRSARQLGVGANAGDLWDAAGAGHEASIAVRKTAVATLAWACQLAVLMLDVDHVVVGGGVSGLGERLVAPVRDRLAEREASSAFLASIEVSRRVLLAPTGIELGALGAAFCAESVMAEGSA